MKWVDDIRDWWKWHSTWFFAAIGSLPSVWLASPDLQAMLPVPVVAQIAPFIALIGFIVRARKQSIKCKPEDEDKP